MPLFNKKKQTTAVVLLFLIVVLQSFSIQGGVNDKAINLQVIYPDIPHEALIKDMKDISRSLGVKCGYCHVALNGSINPENSGYDFASDAKNEKLVARQMMIMTAYINTDYISKLNGDKKANLVTCVTCHMGSVHPTFNVDSLDKH